MAHIVWDTTGRRIAPLRPVVLLVLAFTILCCGLLIWPTRWVIVSSSTHVYRVDRLTGCYQFATDTGWSRPWQKTC